MSTILITGGRGGLGLAMATRFHSLGWQVLTPTREGVWADIDSLDALDVLVCNGATPGPVGPFLDNNLSQWMETIHANLIVPAMQVQAALELMVPAQRGKIILLSGGGAVSPRPNFSAYATSKAGLLRFGETLAEELRSVHVTVNLLAPGKMPTNMTHFEGDPSQINRAVDLAVFLASSESDGVTGQLIHANSDWRTDYARPSAR